MRTLFEMLTDYPMPLLRGIAQTRGVPLTATRAKEAAGQLSAALSREESVLQALSSLPEEAKSVLARLVAAGGRMTGASFQRIAGTIRSFGVGGLERAAPWRTPESVAEVLWYRGLMGRAFADTPAGAAEFFFVPEEVLPLVKGRLPQVSLPTLTLDPVQHDPLPWPPFSRSLEDVCTLLAQVYFHAPRQVGTAWRDGEWSAMQLLLLEPDMSPLLWLLVTRLGWVDASRGRWRLATQHLRGWLEQDRPGQTETVFKAWCDSTEWSDLCQVPGLRCIESGWRENPVRTRYTVLAHLTRVAAQHPEGAWFRITKFIAAIREVDPDFQRPDGDYQSWYIQNVETGHYLRGFESWDAVEGALLAYLLVGPLRAFGAVQIMAIAGEELPTLFRVTPLGRWLLGIGPRPDHADGAGITIKDDFTVTLPEDYRLVDRLRVVRFAEPLNHTPGPPWHYRIHRERVDAARKRGLSPQRILEFLRETSGDNVPDSVAGLLLLDASPEIPARRAVTLEVPPELAAYLQNHDELGRLLIGTSRRNTLLVEATDWPKVRHLLQRLGIRLVDAAAEEERTAKK